MRLDPRVHEGASVMHLAATASRLTRLELFSLPQSDLLRLLASVGADPNAVDANGFRPIGRILTATHVLSDVQKAELIAALVLDCGAHFDASVMPIPTDGDEGGVETEEDGGDHAIAETDSDPDGDGGTLADLFVDEDMAVTVRSLYNNCDVEMQPVSERIDTQTRLVFVLNCSVSR